jgi:sortase (surface protein transpeptidase)
VNRRPNRTLTGLFALVLALAVSGGIPTPALSRGARDRRAAQAQTDRRCFRETGYCVAGRIREYWEQNGGLSVFGFPITPEQDERVEDQPARAQWFERARFELHPENALPYDVLLGRLGVERLRGQGRDWKKFPHAEAGPDCRAFAETGHAICGAFLAAWQSNGLNFDGDPAISEPESLALFGLPLSDAQSERQSDGNVYLVQWFERARFELHPENAPPYDVLLGLLGSESTPAPAAPPEPIRASAPTRLAIDAIGLDMPIYPVPINEDGAPVVLDHDIGWWNASAAPGNGDNVVFWAHVLRFINTPEIPAPFEQLAEVPLGARVTVYDDLGAAHAYAVTRRVQVTPDQVEYMLPQGREMVTMISCYGEQVVVDGAVVDMSHRLIVIAEPVPFP